MIKKFSQLFLQLSSSNKALVYLNWSYAFCMNIAATFVGIYVYKINHSFETLILFSLIYFSATLVGFSGAWSLVSKLQINIKYLFYFSYASFIFGYLLLLLWWGESAAFLYGACSGLGVGLYFNGIHVQELANIQDQERDFYSSLLSMGKSLIKVITPFLVAALFLFAEAVETDAYLMIFSLIPLLFLASMTAIHKVPDYIPQKIQRADIKNFFNIKKYWIGHLVFLITGLQDAMLHVILPLIGFFLLKTEVNIGVFQGILGLLSVVLVMWLALKRTPKNRWAYVRLFGGLLFAVFLLFAFHFSLWGYIFFSLVLLILQPLYTPSIHTYTLMLMDAIKTETSDFYPAMIMREFLLWLWRVLVLGGLFVILKIIKVSPELVLQGGLLWVAFMFLAHILTLHLWEKYEHKPS